MAGKLAGAVKAEAYEANNAKADEADKDPIIHQVAGKKDDNEDEVDETEIAKTDGKFTCFCGNDGFAIFLFVLTLIISVII